MKLLIEVGAFDGKDSLKYHSNGYKVFTFEPKKDLFEDLSNRTKELKNYTVINKAVCKTNGKTIFNICRNGGASSILEFKSKDELIKNWGENRKDIHFANKSYEVETIRLDTFLEEYKLENTMIDFLHIDAQGVDLEVLESLGDYIQNVIEGVVETVKDKEKSIYVNQNENTYDNVKKFLEKNNFKITKVVSNDKTGCEFNVFFKQI